MRASISSVNGCDDDDDDDDDIVCVCVFVCLFVSKCMVYTHQLNNI